MRHNMSCVKRRQIGVRDAAYKSFFGKLAAGWKRAVGQTRAQLRARADAVARDEGLGVGEIGQDAGGGDARIHLPFARRTRASAEGSSRGW